VPSKRQDSTQLCETDVVLAVSVHAVVYMPMHISKLLVSSATSLHGVETLKLGACVVSQTRMASPAPSPPRGLRSPPSYGCTFLAAIDEPCVYFTPNLEENASNVAVDMVPLLS
jgi:hypothetical protein